MGTCSYGDAFNDLTEWYACGVTATYSNSYQFGDSDSGALPYLPPFPGPGISRCCAMRSKPVHRIPGNTGCDTQWCEVPVFNGTYTTTWAPTDYYYSMYATDTASGAVQTPIVQVGGTEEPNPDVKQCIFALTASDLGLSEEQLSSTNGTWSVQKFCSLRTFTPCPDGSHLQCSSTESSSMAAATMSSAMLSGNDDGVSASRTSDVASSSTSSANVGSRKVGTQPAGVMGWMAAGLAMMTVFFR